MGRVLFLRVFLFVFFAHSVSLRVLAQPVSGAVKPALKPALTVQWVSPSQQRVPMTISANGSIAAWAEAVVSAEVGGARLTHIDAQMGDVVKKGQVLAKFSTANAQIELELAKAQVAQAQAAAADATAKAERARAIENEGFYSPAQLTQIFSQEKAAIAAVRAASVKQVAAELTLKETDVVAPDDGVLSSKTALLGAVVPAGAELFRLIRQGRLEWRAELTESEAAGIRPQQSVLLAGQVSGKVRLVAPTLDVSNRTVMVYVDLSTPQATRAGLRAGTYARGEFSLGAQAMQLTLPQSALILRDGFSYVFVRTSTPVPLAQGLAKVSQVKVQTGARVRIDGVDRVVITHGLSPQALVVASGAAFLADGDTVKVVQP